MQKDSRKNEERLLPFETIKVATEGDVDKNFAPKQNERDCPLTQSICYYPFWGKSILILGKKLFLEIAQYQEVLLCVRKVTKEDVRKRI